jgi:hypothetical protein
MVTSTGTAYVLPQMPATKQVTIKTVPYPRCPKRTVLMVFVDFIGVFSPFPELWRKAEWRHEPLTFKITFCGVEFKGCPVL